MNERVVFLPLALLLSTLAQAQTFQIDSARSKAEFDIRNMLVAQTHGTMKNVSGDVILDEANPSASKVTATVDPSTVDTGTPKRDDHLKTADFFDVAKFAAIRFESTEVVRTKDHAYTVKGTLTMHGVSKPVTLEATVSGQGAERHVVATGVLSRKEFGVGSSITIADEAKVTLDVTLVAR